LRDDAGRSSVSPEGRQIAFISGRKEAEIWVMGSDGGDARRVAQAGADGRFLQVQWSPDGRRLAYMKSAAGGNAPKISIESLDPTTGDTRQMFSSPGLQSFSWTAEGKLFLALQEPPPNEHDTNLWQASVRADGALDSAPHQVTKWAGFSFWDLSATADGRRLAFVKSGSQADVYIGKLDQRRLQLADVRRLTLNEHDDLPSAWTSDGAVLFYSDRNGHFDIFRQDPTAEQAEQVLGSSEDKLKPEFNADGKWLLYWRSDQKDSQHSRKLMKMSIAGGAVTPVLEGKPGAEFHCARSKPICVLAESDPHAQEVIFSRFDVESGEKTQIASSPRTGTSDLTWSLGADGSTIAFADAQETGTTVRTFTLPESKSREYDLKGVVATGIASLSSGWLLTSSSLRGNELVYVSHAGQVQQLWSSSSPLSAPVSNDGQMVAFGLASQDSNAWLLEQK